MTYATEEERKQQQNQRQKESRWRKREWVRQQKSRPCADCGGTFPTECMDFDHVPERGPKLFNICAQQHAHGRERLEIELAKCDVVCANCHRVRTTARIANRERIPARKPLSDFGRTKPRLSAAAIKRMRAEQRAERARLKRMERAAQKVAHLTDDHT